MVKIISLRHGLVCFKDFVAMILFALLFLLLPPNCSLRVCPHTPFAAVLKFFLPLITSANSCTANSNKSAPTRFAAGTTYLHKKGFAVLRVTCASVPNPRPGCRPSPLRNGILLVL